MKTEQSTLNEIYNGWEEYQRKLLLALTPLTDEQLTLRAAPSLRSIGEIATHMVGARARWFNGLLGEGGDDIKAMAAWDRRGSPAKRSSAELVKGFEATWRLMSETRARWTPAEWEHTYRGEYSGEPYAMTRSWVLWHLIEHDLHHGGEISLTLGMNSLTAPDI